MSSILEALKKLEDEKAARRGGIGNIAGRVTSPPRRTRTMPGWFWGAAMAAVAVCAVFVTFTLMGGFRHHLPSTPPALPAPAAVPGATPVPAPGAAPAADTPPPSSPPVTTAGESFPSATASLPAQQPPPKVTPKPEPAPAARPLPTPQPVQPATVSKEPPLPAFHVSGIAWQADQASRLAILNGQPVSEGAMIEEARVDEIFPDRVRLSLRGKSFDVTLDKAP